MNESRMTKTPQHESQVEGVSVQPCLAIAGPDADGLRLFSLRLTLCDGKPVG